LVNAAVMALLVASIAEVWFHNWALRGIFALALIVNVANGAAAGTLIPSESNQFIGINRN
jgi:Mg/Co/Ni transporter MgtE